MSREAFSKAARAWAIVMAQRAVTIGDLGAAQLKLTMAVSAWENWAADQKFGSQGS